MKKRTPLLLLALVFLLAACQATPAAAGKTVKVGSASYQDISVSELQDMLKNKDFTLVNVHIPFAGNLPSTDLSIPYDTISHNLNLLPQDKNARIVLYCQSGSMSTSAAVELARQGYTHVMNLDGGMSAWEAAGQKIEK